MPIRSLLAFLIAPGLSPITLWVWSRFSTPQVGTKPSVTGFLFLAALTYSAAIVLGVPIYLWLLQKRLTSWWHLTIAGVITGVCTSLIFGIGEFSSWSIVYISLACTFSLPWGALTGFVFWLIAHAGQSSRLNA